MNQNNMFLQNLYFFTSNQVQTDRAASAYLVGIFKNHYFNLKQNFNNDVQKEACLRKMAR